MKTKAIKFSIFVLLFALVCSCVLVFVGKKSDIRTANAVEIKDGLYLVSADGQSVYKANKPVGTVAGAGLYVVGEKNVSISANANENFQIVGFEIVYSEQVDETEYVWFKEMGVKLGSAKEVDLKSADGQISTVATISVDDASPVGLNNYAKTATFTIATVFESMEITPIFDHIYANVQIDDLMEILKPHDNNNSVETEEGTLFFKESQANEGVTHYLNSYIIKDDNSYYFYGDVYSYLGEFYTLHETLADEEDKIEEKIDISKGAFRSNEKVDMAFDVGAICDVKSFDLRPLGHHAPTDYLLVDTAHDNHYVLTKDELGATMSFELHFYPKMFEENYGPTTCVYVDFDKLYSIKLNFFVDDEAIPSSDLSDFFGDIKEDTTNNISSGNISVSNYFAIKTQMGGSESSQFLFKKESANNSKALTISCAKTIKAVVDGVAYNYYNFTSLDNDEKTLKTFGSPAIDELIVDIKYSSETYSVALNFLEKIDDKLYPMGKPQTTYKQVERGENVAFMASIKENYPIVGYNFVGFAKDQNSEIEESYTCLISKEKPVDSVVCFVYEKIEYAIVVANFNKINIGGIYPINQMAFTLGGQNEVVQALTGEEYVLQDIKVKIGQTLSFTSVINSGFTVQFSLANPLGEATNGFVVDETLLSQHATADNKVIIYVFEEKISYTLTYWTPLNNDPKVGADVLMAEIVATTVSPSAVIERFDASNQLLAEDDTNTLVAKIVVSHLAFGDKVFLSSKGRTADADITPYTYMFSGFFEQTNNFTDYSTSDEEIPTFTRTHEVTRNVEIFVKYAMPTTKIIVKYDVLTNDLADAETIDFVYEFSQELKELDSNEFEVDVAKTITVTISNIDFGYSLYGYELVEDKKGIQKNVDITISTIAGSNTIKIIFQRINYQFKFAQFKMENGVENQLGETVDKTVNVKDLTIQMTKTLGQYVYYVKFAHSGQSQYEYEHLSAKLSENNEGKNNPSTQWQIELTKQEMGELVLNCGQGFNGNVIKAKIVFVPYSYDVTLNYAMNEKAGSSILFPAVGLYNILADTTEQEIKSAQDHNPGTTKTIVFQFVPYGTNAKLILANELMLGLKWNGWEINGQTWTDCNATYAMAGVINRDMAITYNIAYEAFDLNIIYDMDEGEPVLKVQSSLSGLTSNKITLFDKLEIEAKAKRNTAGMKLFRFVQPIKYEYDELSWLLDWDKLFYYNLRGEKIFNNSEEFNPSLTYFKDVKVLAEQSDVDMDTYVDDVFLWSDYMVTGMTISIVVEYEKIVFNLNHKFADVSLNGGAKGSEYELLFDEVYYFVDQDGNRIESLKSDITFGETLDFYVQINKTAKNEAEGFIDQNVYDLSKGVELDYVTVGSLSRVGVGLFKLNLEMTSALIPDVGVEIPIDYYFTTATRSLSITTQITNSSFYQSGMMMINPMLCGWGNNSLQSGNKMVELKENLQYLSSAQTYVNFEFVGYDLTYEISKVTINGEVYSKQDFEKGMIGCSTAGVKIIEHAKYGFVVVAQMWENVACSFYVQPKVSYGQDGPNFEREFQCGNDAVGIAQKLSVGNDENSCDIIVGEQLVDVVKVVYLKSGMAPDVSVVDEGAYIVQISFTPTEQMPWVNQMTISGDVTITITKKKLWLVDARGDEFEVKQKDYSGSSEYDIKKALEYITLTDKNEFESSYNSLVGLGFSFGGETKASANSVTDAGIKTANASESVYDLLLENLHLSGGKANNFSLQDASFILKDFIKINKVKLSLVGVEVENKVFDNTTNAVLKNREAVKLVGVVNNDSLTLKVETMQLHFTNASIGENKEVSIINLKDSIEGATKDNYVIDDPKISTSSAIYPYSISIFIRGVGEITVFNQRGITDKSKVHLIPIDATLKVETIMQDSNEYRGIYKSISQHLKGNNAFAIGYSLSIVVDGEEEYLNKDLFVKVPRVRNLTGTLYLSNSKSGKISADVEKDGIVVDLSQIPYNVQNLVFIQQRVLLKPWQIVLIVLLIAVVIGGVVAIFIVVRKRKSKDSSIHEKI